MVEVEEHSICACELTHSRLVRHRCECAWDTKNRRTKSADRHPTAPTGLGSSTKVLVNIGDWETNRKHRQAFRPCALQRRCKNQTLLSGPGTVPMLCETPSFAGVAHIRPRSSRVLPFDGPRRLRGRPKARAGRGSSSQVTRRSMCYSHCGRTKLKGVDGETARFEDVPADRRQRLAMRSPRSPSCGFRLPWLPAMVRPRRKSRWSHRH